MPETPDSIRKALGGIAKASAQVDRNGAAIKTAGAERMADIDRKLAELRPSTLTDEASAREYSDLIEERGRLSETLAL